MGRLLTVCLSLVAMLGTPMTAAHGEDSEDVDSPVTLT
jgi:hypothetical protein